MTFLSREDDFVTLKHKCSNSTSQSKSQLDDRNPSNGTPGSLKTNGLHVHNVARASPKQNIESNIRGSDKHGVRDFQKTSTDNMCSCSVNCNVIREENIWRDPHGNSKQEPSGKHDVYELLMAQEQQLKELKEQLETLIRERKDTSSSTSPVSIPKSADNEVLEKLKCTGVKQTNSAGTMTSFAWPMSSSRNVNCTPKHDGKEHFIQIDISDKNSTVSPEVLRRQSIMSIVSEDDDIMRNLQLPNFGNSVDTSQYSDIIVDLPGYPDSLSE